MAMFKFKELIIVLVVVADTLFKTSCEYVPLTVKNGEFVKLTLLRMRVHVIPSVDISVSGTFPPLAPTIIAIVGLIIFMSYIAYIPAVPRDGPAMIVHVIKSYE